MSAKIILLYFNPRSPREGATGFIMIDKDLQNISIHAPRVGSDCFKIGFLIGVCISIHAPRVGSDRSQQYIKHQKKKFQSTLPVWGATHLVNRSIPISSHFNPRSPCGERQQHAPMIRILTKISIHAPRVGSDVRGLLQFYGANHFNPRSPCGERQRMSLLTCL